MYLYHIDKHLLLFSLKTVVVFYSHSVDASSFLSLINDPTPPSVVPRSRFLGDTGVPLPEIQGDIYKFWGTHQIFQIFTC